MGGLESDNSEDAEEQSTSDSDDSDYDEAASGAADTTDTLDSDSVSDDDADAGADQADAGEGTDEGAAADAGDGAASSFLPVVRPQSRRCTAPPLVILYITDPLYAGMYSTGTARPSGRRLFFTEVYDRDTAAEARAAAYPVPLVALDLPRFGGMRLIRPGAARYPDDIAEQLAAVPEVRGVTIPWRSHCLR
jgi:hypothetical protein